MDYKHTCDTIFTHFQSITNNIYGFGRLFWLLHFLNFYPSIFVFTRPNDGWTGLYIKLWLLQCMSTKLLSLATEPLTYTVNVTECVYTSKEKTHPHTCTCCWCRSLGQLAEKKRFIAINYVCSTMFAPAIHTAQDSSNDFCKCLCYLKTN